MINSINVELIQARVDLFKLGLILGVLYIASTKPFVIVSPNFH